MQSLREKEPNNRPKTPEEGAQVALGSVCEEVGQKITAIDMSLDLLLKGIPEDHPLRPEIKIIAEIADRANRIVRKYRDAGFSGEFNFDTDRSGNSCLDIHPLSSTSLSKQR